MSDTRFKPVAKTTLADDVAKQIIGMIHGGTYATGDRLPTINDMAAQFGVGHPTLREALKKLQALGLVEIKHGSGVYIREHSNGLLMSNPIYSGDLSKKMMVDLIDARICIESMTARLAAENATEGQLSRMNELLETASENMDDDEVLSSTNMAFHGEIAVASGNLVLGQVLEVLVDLFKAEQQTILDIYGDRSGDHDAHRSIFDAIRQGDPELSEERMRGHLGEVRDVLLKWDDQRHPV